jgi:hypothetical protein
MWPSDSSTESVSTNWAIAPYDERNFANVLAPRFSVTFDSNRSRMPRPSGRERSGQVGE